MIFFGWGVVFCGSLFVFFCSCVFVAGRKSYLVGYEWFFYVDVFWLSVSQPHGGGTVQAIGSFRGVLCWAREVAYFGFGIASQVL